MRRTGAPGTGLDGAAEALAGEVLARGSTVVALGVADAGADLVDLVRGVASPAPVLDVGSVTKVVVTAELHRRLGTDLAAPVSRWFPALPGDVTVADLMTHRAGLRPWWPLYLAGARDRDSAVALAAALPPGGPRGVERRYSDLGYVLAGAVLEREHDAPLEDLLARHVVEPLGMTASGYRPRGSTQPTDDCVPTSLGDRVERQMVATGTPYAVDDAVRDAAADFAWRTHRLLGEANDGNCWHALGGVAGHAGLFTTVADLARFGRALLADALSGAEPVGWWPTPRRLEHPGFPGARLAVLPDVERVVVLLTNRLHGPGDPPDLTPPWERLVRAVEEDAR